MEALIIVMSLVSWLALCGVAASIASKKGRSGEDVFFLSLLLSPLVGLIVAATMEPNLAAQGKKKCPNCAEFVQPDARVCRFCQHSFVEEQMEAARLQAERQAQLLEEANKQEAARLAAAAEEAKKPWLRRNLAIVVFVVVAVTFPTAVLRFISLVDPTKSQAIKRTEPQAPFAHPFASAPGNGCVSDIEELTYIAVSESSAHQIAREKKEAIQQECDKLDAVMHEELAKCKALALENAPDRKAKSDCVRTENKLMASSEAVNKRLNASVKALNAVTWASL